MVRLIVTNILLLITCGVSGQQLGSPQMPTFNTPRPVAIGVTTPTTHHQASKPSVTTESLATRNQQAIAEFGKHTPTSTPYRGSFRFADWNSSLDTALQSSFDYAANGLKQMLSSGEKVDLVEAVYLAENPLVGDMLTLARLKEIIDILSSLVKNDVRSRGLDPTNPLALHLGVQRLFQDSIFDPVSKRWMSPLRYDFTDYLGEEQLGNITVGKLLLSGKGQCRSMPLLYLLLAQELGIEAYLAFSPNHSYVKFQANNRWYNFETTSGVLSSDAWIIGNGYVKSEAIQSGAYMDTVSTRKVVAHLLAELSYFHSEIFGYDENFSEPILEQALAIYPNDLHAMSALSNLRTAYMDRALYEAGYPRIEQLNRYPLLQHQHEALMSLYESIDDMGFSVMPDEAYQAWLASVDKRKQKQLEAELTKGLSIDPTLR